MTTAGGDAGKIGVVVVHGVADTEQGINLKTLVRTLEARSVGGLAIEAEDHFEVRELEEASLVTGKLPPLAFYLRRATFGGIRPMTFAEVYWADTTRVATGKATALWAAFRIVFEMHYFINALVRRDGDGWLATLYARTLHVAAGLIRGPLAGANVVLLSVGTVYLFARAVAAFAKYPDVLISAKTGALLACAALLAYWVWVLITSAREKDIASMEVGLGTVAAAVAALFAAAYLPQLEGEAYVVAFSQLIFKGLIWVWLLLCAAMLFAFVLAVVLTLAQSSSGARSSVWSALALVVLQATLWILFISIPAVLLLGWANIAGIGLGDIEGVKDGFAMNVIGIMAIGGAVRLVWAWRSAVARSAGAAGDGAAARREKLRETGKNMPRLIVNGIIVAMIVVFCLAHIGAEVIWFCGWMKWGFCTLSLGKPNPCLSLVLSMLIIVAAIGIYAVLDTKNFVNVVHIARDLIDHHHDPRNSFVSLIFKVLPEGLPPYPRRERLLSRVTKSVEYLTEQDGCDTLVFVAHSQGTVIVFDFLRRTVGQQKVAVVSFGSPLQHLYGHFFQGYAHLGAELDARPGGASAWTNLHRIDDPIGNRIDASKWIDNIAMERGGHTNYWPEKDVADAILRTLSALRGAAATATPQTPSAPPP